MENMRNIEMEAIGTMVAACMEELGFDRSRGAKAIFCIACCGAMEEKEAGQWSAARMAHGYAAFIGSTQTAVWQAMVRAVARSKWPGHVSEVIYALARWGAAV